MVRAPLATALIPSASPLELAQVVFARTSISPRTYLILLCFTPPKSIRNLRLGPLADAGMGRTTTVRTIPPMSHTPMADSSAHPAPPATPPVSPFCSSKSSGIRVPSTTGLSGLQVASPSSSVWVTREYIHTFGEEEPRRRKLLCTAPGMDNTPTTSSHGRATLSRGPWTPALTVMESPLTARSSQSKVWMP